MGNFRLLGHPWWVNLLLLVPLVAYFLFRREKPQLTSRELLITAMFALSFGFVEGAVAIYLGVAVGLLPDMRARSPTLPDYPQTFTGNRASP
jgi:uncharacterized membrane protein YfcA